MGSMIRACRDCTPIVLPAFEQGWTRENFTVMCHEILASGNAQLPDDGTWRYCHFCQRKTNLDDVAHFSEPSFCPQCEEKLTAWHAQGYLDLLAKTAYRVEP